MRYKYKEVYNDIINGNTAHIELVADGVTYIRKFAPAGRLIILGGGNVAQALCPYASDLGFDVNIVDDRPDFANKGVFPTADVVICENFVRAIQNLSVNNQDYVAVMTRGHRYDTECLRTLLKGRFPRYLGLLGSKRRVDGLFKILEAEGFSESDINKIHAPIGVPIAALTVKEIAVSIIAELILEKRKDTPRHSGSTLLTEDDVNLDLIKALAFDEIPGALMTVIETEGSTPVKSGAMMMIDRNLRTIGTIGGGCSEYAVLKEARKIIGTGKSVTVCVDMGGDIPEAEGMVCGGQMKVLVEDTEL